MSKVRVLICGDRDWSCFRCIRALVVTLPKDAVVIEGEARGADRMARIAAEESLLEVLPFPAKWDSYGPSAGPIRNREMLKVGAPTRVVAFHNDIAQSKGTKHMVETARAAGVPVEVRTCPHRKDGATNE